MSKSPNKESQAASRLAEVERRIHAACARSGRAQAEVTLVGASKRQPVERLRASASAGLRVFGESQIQEASVKIPELPVGLEWHFIGTLQSNKAKIAARLFSTVHSLDRVKIARALDHHAGLLGRRLQGFIQVHLGSEPSKHGFPEDAESLLIAARPLKELEHLEIVGLMAIPPREESEEHQRAWFQKLRDLRDVLAREKEWEGFRGCLSMGMSRDFEIAIEEGATHVRVGSSLFGPRQASAAP